MLFAEKEMVSDLVLVCQNTQVILIADADQSVYKTLIVIVLRLVSTTNVKILVQAFVEQMRFAECKIITQHVVVWMVTQAAPQLVVLKWSVKVSEFSISKHDSFLIGSFTYKRTFYFGEKLSCSY
jgi:hypothetical protein